MPSKKDPVALDADGILYDFVRTCASFVNSLTNDNRAAYENANRFDVLSAWGASHLKFAVDSVFEQRGIVSGMPIIKGACDFVEAVRAITMNNFVVITACPATWHNERERALQSDFGINKRQVNFGYDKNLFKVSMLLDDYHQNFNNFEGWRVLMDRPWNQDTEGVACRRVFGFDEALYEIDRVYNWNSR